MDNINSLDIDLINNRIIELNKNITKTFKKNNENNIPINISDYYIFQQLKNKYKLKYQLFIYFHLLCFLNYNNYLTSMNSKISNKLKYLANKNFI